VVYKCKQDGGYDVNIRHFILFDALEKQVWVEFRHYGNGNRNEERVVKDLNGAYERLRIRSGHWRVVEHAYHKCGRKEESQ
jgi:outer membrane phospholipase A